MISTPDTLPRRSRRQQKKRRLIKRMRACGTWSATRQRVSICKDCLRLADSIESKQINRERTEGDMKDDLQEILILLQPDWASVSSSNREIRSHVDLSNTLESQCFVDAFLIADEYADHRYRFPVVFRFEEFDLSLDYSPETPALRVFVHQGDALKQLDQPFKARDPYAEECLHWTRLNEVKNASGR